MCRSQQAAVNKKHTKIKAENNNKMNEPKQHAVRSVCPEVQKLSSLVLPTEVIIAQSSVPGEFR